MTTPNAQDFLMGGGGVTSATFPAIGAVHSGTICEEPTISQQRDLATSKPQFWDDGNPKLMLVVTLQTTVRDPSIEDDDGKRRLYVKANMRNAIADAVRKAGATGLALGGTLTVGYVSDGVQEQRGFNPPKVYAASYVPPPTPGESFLSAPSVASTHAGVAPEIPPAAITTPVPGATVPVPPAFATQLTAEQIAAMKAAGIDVSKFASV